MMKLMIAIVLALTGHSCRERQPLASTEEEAGESADQTAEPTVIVVEKPVVVPISDPVQPATPQESKDLPAETKTVEPPAPPPPILVKAQANYAENCIAAKKLEITSNAIKLTTDNFLVKGDAESIAQCLVTMDVTVDKGKRLVPVINPQAYFAGNGMLSSGQSLQIDMNILTLNGDAIEASLEYQSIVQGPIGNDTDFIRPFQLLRRISPPCQTQETARRVLVVQIVLSLDKGTAAALPIAMARDLPRIDYVLETCP